MSPTYVRAVRLTKDKRAMALFVVIWIEPNDGTLVERFGQREYVRYFVRYRYFFTSLPDGRVKYVY